MERETRQATLGALATLGAVSLLVLVCGRRAKPDEGGGAPPPARVTRNARAAKIMSEELGKCDLRLSRGVNVEMFPGRRGKVVRVAPDAVVTIAILGAADLDVATIALDSLVAYGARPAATKIQDVSGDGIPDLVVDFPSTETALHRKSNRLPLVGRMTSSRQCFRVNAEIEVDATAPEPEPQKERALDPALYGSYRPGQMD